MFFEARHTNHTQLVSTEVLREGTISQQAQAV